jgi:hypothetical protein
MRDQIVLCASGAIATSSHDVAHVASGKQLNCFLHALPLAAGESTARVKMPRDEAYVVMLHGVCAPRLLIYRGLSYGAGNTTLPVFFMVYCGGQTQLFFK